MDLDNIPPITAPQRERIPSHSTHHRHLIASLLANGNDITVTYMYLNGMFLTLTGS